MILPNTGSHLQAGKYPVNIVINTFRRKAGPIAERSKSSDLDCGQETRVQLPAGVEIFSTFFQDGELSKLPYCLQFTHVQ